MVTVCYSANFGGYDNIYTPSVNNQRTKWLYYTDRPELNNVWHIKTIKQRELSPCLQARYFKTHPPDAEYSIWMDSSIELLIDPADLLLMLGNNDILMYPHPERKVLEDEAYTIVRIKNIPESKALGQAAQYRAYGFVGQVPLPATGLIVRKHGKKVSIFNEMWWKEINQWCIRDQMSVGYCAWKAELNVGYIDGNLRDGKYIRINRHNNAK